MRRVRVVASLTLLLFCACACCGLCVRACARGWPAPTHTMTEPCRFHFTGGCARGSACRFSHDDAPLAVVACPYHHTPAGCKYGAACQFRHDRPGARRGGDGALPVLPSGEDLAPGFEDGAAPTRGEEGIRRADEADPAAAAAERTWGGLSVIDDDSGNFGRATATGAAASPWAATVGGGGGGGGVDGVAAALAATTLTPTTLPANLCGQWAAAGACTRGDRCHLAHGDWCEGCERYALHPTDEAAAAGHVAACAAASARVAAAAAAADVECGVCLERPLMKSRPGERRFGLLACDHAFCLGCIRAWRAQVVATGASVGVEAARACPACRTPSHFVVPSAVWPACPADKEAIIGGYLAALARTPCRNFANGRGTCPHGSSCLYRHADEHGVEVDRAAGLRWVGDEDGVVKPMNAGVRLGDFLTTAAGRPGGRRRG